MGCIKNYWDQTDHTGVYSCPQCRKTFNPRPDLGRNTMLAEIVEKLKKTGLNPPPAQSSAGPGDVPCDFCTGRKFKAVKSCLTCLASYCETHVKSHSEVTTLKRHKLVNAIGNLEQKLCAEHQKNQLGDTQREIQQRIQERLKEIEELKQAVESLKRSACIEIKESEKIFTELIRSIEKIHTEVIELVGANEKAAVNQAEGCMKKLEQEIAELRRRNAEMKQLSETEDHIHFLQNFQSLCAPPEAGDLPSVTVNTDISFGAVRKAVSELKDHIEDFCKGELVKITTTGWCETLSFGRDFSNRPWLEEGQDLQDINKDLLQIVGYMNIAAGRMEEGGDSREEWEAAGRREQGAGRREHGRRRREEEAWTKAQGGGSMEEGAGSREEKTWKKEQEGGSREYTAGTDEAGRREQGGASDVRMKQTMTAACLMHKAVLIYLKYSCQLTLDPNTAYRELCLSEGNRKVTLRRDTQRYPDHSERFDFWDQVLCREGLSGTRCYWEIEWSVVGASIGVTYKGISRKGEDHSCVLGCNDKSWCLSCSDSSYTAWHNNNQTAITAPHSPRIGVYLDFNAGTLSFYVVSDTMTLLHRFQTTFTEPLYPGFWLHCYDSSVTICQLN
ncbi:UNVERIFIED_CONTAM: hypothetical protein FKN15_012087 [Acipenser sinensis]